MENDDGSALGRELGRAAGGDPTPTSFARLASLVGASARAAGAGAVASGRWLADVAIELAGHLPIRDLATLESQLELREEQLADRLVRNASVSSATLGAVGGAVVGAEQLAPPTWALIPGELALETLLLAGIEMKLLAELQAVHGRPVQGSGTEKGVALAKAWAERRGVRAGDLVVGGGLADVIGRQARLELTKALRRRLLRRMGRNLGQLAPLMAGAVAGAELNRRATLDFAAKVRRDLATPDRNPY